MSERATSELADLRERLRAFAQERDWEPFHTPRNLAATVAVEAAELLEPFRWALSGEVSELSAAEHHTRNPLSFMELQDVQEVTNFFERRVSAYQVGVTGDVVLDATF